MRLYRFLFDVGAFILPMRWPGLLIVYCLVHFFAPNVVYWPRRLDGVRHRANLFLWR